MSHNTWLHRCVRKPVKALANTWVSPNHITAARLCTGLAAAALYAHGSPNSVAIGSLCFFVSMLLDRADGELARLTGAQSAWGHRFDLVTDTLCNSLVFVGIGIGASAGLWGHWALLMGVVAGAAVVLVLALVIRLESQSSQGAAGFDANAGFDPDDAMIAIPVAMAAGLQDGLLPAAAIGAPLAAAIVYVLFRKRAQ